MLQQFPSSSDPFSDLCCAGEYVISGGADGSVHVVNQVWLL